MPPQISIEELAQQFCQRTLPCEAWTHHAHLKVGLWHLAHYPYEEALSLIRQRIQFHNDRCGVENSDHSGYHETITRLYLKLIEEFYIDVNKEKSLDQLGEELIEALGAKDLPFKYYTKEVLFSVEARRGWVAPDIKELP